MPTREQPDHETDFLTHFAELRARLWWCVAAVAVMMGVGWFLFDSAYALLCGPVVAAVRAQGGTVMTMGLTEAFFTRMKLAGALGIIFASPIILWQVWAFIRPGLTARERRVAAPIAPAVCLLFLLGAGLAYLMLPKIIAFFLTYVQGLQGVTPNLMLQESINFPLKVLFAFGLGFQLPVVLVALVALRILTPRTLLRQWRVALFVMTLLAAVITPTADPFNWALLMAPLCVLYFGTVLIAYRLVKPATEEDA
ncbi:MAG: Sec-independent protein translocase protein TatCy [bacterium ADurb.Bin429]|nr:MAG: Sec-independent protein translocase protein TatCy [bacterium ADurb.Bin429]